MIIASPRPKLLATLPLRPEAGRMARTEMIACALSEDMLHTAQLLVTELVANSLRHGALEPGEGEIALFAAVAPDRVRIEVADAGPGFDRHDDGAPRGLGLRLLDKLATDWGTSRNDSEFRVWFEIDRRPRRFSRDGTAL